MAARNVTKDVHNPDSLPQVFNFDAITVRTFNDEGEIWFAAADVCAALDIINPTRATSRLDDDEKGLHTVKTPGGNQEIVTINESGLYSLIMTSRKEEAKKFKRWVTHDVLPSIRQTGSYSAAPAAPAPVTIEDKSQPEIDVRALLLEGQSTPSVPVPADVQKAIDQRAFVLAHEAYELCREHLARRVAYTSEMGMPRYLNKRRALEVIKKGDLNHALAHSYYGRLSQIASFADYARTTAIQFHEDMQKLTGESGE